MTTPNDVEKLAARVEELAAEVSRLGSDLSDMAAVLELSNETVPAAPAADVLEPVYQALDEWVEQYFLVVFARPTGGELRWCAQWRAHPEAVVRLEALWRSWEAMRTEPNLGIASWLVSYMDPILAVLLARQGTFASCSSERHSESRAPR